MNITWATNNNKAISLNKEITKDQFHQLLGLLTVAYNLNQQLLEIETAACIITGEEVNSCGFTCDAIYSRTQPNIAVMDLLRTMQISVK